MNDKQKVLELLKKNRVGMLVTNDDGKLFSRPIAVTDVDDNSNIWFFTDINSEKVETIYDNNQVNFSFSNEDDNEYISVSGSAHIITSQQIIDEKWKFFLKAWFPEGKEAEKLILIKVKPQSVEFWDDTNSRLVQIYTMARSLMSGKSYVEVSNSENKTIHYTD